MSERKPTKNYPCKGYCGRNGKPMVEICWVHNELTTQAAEIERLTKENEEGIANQARLVQEIERLKGLLKKARVLLEEAEFYLAANGCKYPTKEIQAYLKEVGE